MTTTRGEIRFSLADQKLLKTYFPHNPGTTTLFRFLLQHYINTVTTYQQLELQLNSGLMLEEQEEPVKTSKKPVSKLTITKALDILTQEEKEDTNYADLIDPLTENLP